MTNYIDILAIGCASVTVNSVSGEVKEPDL